jgi:hypothetical protein
VLLESNHKTKQYKRHKGNAIAIPDKEKGLLDTDWRLDFFIGLGFSRFLSRTNLYLLGVFWTVLIVLLEHFRNISLWIIEK